MNYLRVKKLAGQTRVLRIILAIALCLTMIPVGAMTVFAKSWAEQNAEPVESVQESANTKESANPSQEDEAAYETAVKEAQEKNEQSLQEAKAADEKVEADIDANNEAAPVLANNSNSNVFIEISFVVDEKYKYTGTQTNLRTFDQNFRIKCAYMEGSLSAAMTVMLEDGKEMMVKITGTEIGYATGILKWAYADDPTNLKTLNSGDTSELITKNIIIHPEFEGRDYYTVVRSETGFNKYIMMHNDATEEKTAFMTLNTKGGDVCKVGQGDTDKNYWYGLKGADTSTPYDFRWKVHAEPKDSVTENRGKADFVRWDVYKNGEKQEYDPAQTYYIYTDFQFVPVYNISFAVEVHAGEGTWSDEQKTAITGKGWTISQDGKTATQYFPLNSDLAKIKTEYWNDAWAPSVQYKTGSFERQWYGELTTGTDYTYVYAPQKLQYDTRGIIGGDKTKIGGGKCAVSLLKESINAGDKFKIEGTGTSQTIKFYRDTDTTVATVNAQAYTGYQLDSSNPYKVYGVDNQGAETQLSADTAISGYSKIIIEANFAEKDTAIDIKFYPTSGDGKVQWKTKAVGGDWVDQPEITTDTTSSIAVQEGSTWKTVKPTSSEYFPSTFTITEPSGDMFEFKVIPTTQGLDQAFWSNEKGEILRAFESGSITDHTNFYTTMYDSTKYCDITCENQDMSGTPVADTIAQKTVVGTSQQAPSSVQVNSPFSYSDWSAYGKNTLVIESPNNTVTVTSWVNGDNGYAFVGWKILSNGTSQWVDDMAQKTIPANTTKIIAVYTQVEKVTINVNDDELGEVSQKEIGVPSGTTVVVDSNEPNKINFSETSTGFKQSVTATPKGINYFKDWTDVPGSAITAPVTIKANFTAGHYVTFNFDGGQLPGGIGPQGWEKVGDDYVKAFIDGTTVNDVRNEWNGFVPQKEHYVFIGWENTPSSQTITADTTFKALYKLVKHTVVVDLHDGEFTTQPSGWTKVGTTSRYSKEFDYGTSIETVLNEWSSAGLKKGDYEFAAWDKTTGIVEGDTEINASWQYYVKLVDVADGTIVPSNNSEYKFGPIPEGATVTCNLDEEQTLTLTYGDSTSYYVSLEDGYYLNNWKYDDSTYVPLGSWTFSQPTTIKPEIKLGVVVKGRVVEDFTGLPMKNVPVYLKYYSVSNDSGSNVAVEGLWTETDEDGYYEFSAPAVYPNSDAIVYSGADGHAINGTPVHTGAAGTTVNGVDVSLKANNGMVNTTGHEGHQTFQISYKQYMNGKETKNASFESVEFNHSFPCPLSETPGMDKGTIFTFKDGKIYADYESYMDEQEAAKGEAGQKYIENTVIEPVALTDYSIDYITLNGQKVTDGTTFEVTQDSLNNIEVYYKTAGVDVDATATSTGATGDNLGLIVGILIAVIAAAGIGIVVYKRKNNK